MTASTQTMSAMFYRGQQDRQDYQNSGSAIACGDIVDLGQRIGVCTSPEGIAASGVGSLGSLATAGVFRVKKDTAVTAAAFVKDSEVWWDTVALKAYNAPGSNRIFIGIADEAAPSTHNDVKTDINKLPVQLVQTAVTSGTTSTTTTTTT